MEAGSFSVEEMMGMLWALELAPCCPWNDGAVPSPSGHGESPWVCRTLDEHSVCRLGGALSVESASAVGCTFRPASARIVDVVGGDTMRGIGLLAFGLAGNGLPGNASDTPGVSAAKDLTSWGPVTRNSAASRLLICSASPLPPRPGGSREDDLWLGVALPHERESRTENCRRRAALGIEWLL